jgi:glutathionyl-hydroquinone reductase
MVRYEYPYLDRWLRKLYWDETELTRGAFKKTTHFEHVSGLILVGTVILLQYIQFIRGYAATLKHKTYPRGPISYILPSLDSTPVV